MAYKIIKDGKIHIVYEINDFINPPIWEIIDCRLEEGMSRYKELFAQKRRKHKTQKSLQYLGTRQTTLDEFFPLNYPNQNKVIKKANHKTFGRSRIKKELPKCLECSESMISRILREQQLQNPPKRLASEVKIGIWCPSLASYTGERFSLECGTKNGIILIIFLFNQILEPIIKPFLTEKEIRHVLAYSLGMLFEKPVYQCLEAIPPNLMELLGFNDIVKEKNIAGTLKTLGSYKESIALKKIKASYPKKLALDEKVIERYSKKAHIDTHNDTCQTGYIYCSRRNKGVLAESIEVIADISQEGIALPLYFMFTPHSLTKKEQAKLAELGREIPEQLEPVHTSHDTKDNLSSSSRAKGKRAGTVFSLLDIISSNMGRLPLRFDNNYAQKESIKRLKREKWGFIGHGRSNLKIVKSLKERMKKEKSTYDCENVDSLDHGGAICVVGYQKNDRIHIYLTNEANCKSAEAIIEDYRDRWRLENTFKWVPSLTLLSGSDPIVHTGQFIIAFYFLAYLVHYFRAATPTIISLLERTASVHYENNVLTVSFPKIRKHYWEKLANLQKKLHQSHFSSIQISYDDK